ncbi:hypothetical protein CHS0354_043175 [Potamilus streckersoni]|uniref:Uncharacterized protein n=1 Tax=Potamilus streckersoni TaxID=2493646 RepID=A0AAE0SNG5_9BIVA|nr:hypothetical protein CHS0354_043175 [Potamilus streckersoni]
MFQTRYTLHRYIYQHRVIVGMNVISNVINFELFPLDQTIKIPDKDNDLDEFIDSFSEKENNQTDKFLRLTDDIISRIRFISGQSGYSQDRPISGAIKTLQRIDTRDFYTVHCEIHLERSFVAARTLSRFDNKCTLFGVMAFGYLSICIVTVLALQNNHWFKAKSVSMACHVAMC